jgi:hypothetical protein
MPSSLFTKPSFVIPQSIHELAKISHRKIEANTDLSLMQCTAHAFRSFYPSKQGSYWTQEYSVMTNRKESSSCLVEYVNNPPCLCRCAAFLNFPDKNAFAGNYRFLSSKTHWTTRMLFSSNLMYFILHYFSCFEMAAVRKLNKELELHLRYIYT